MAKEYDPFETKSAENNKEDERIGSYLGFIKSMKAPKGARLILSAFEFKGFDPSQIFDAFMRKCREKEWSEDRINSTVYSCVAYFAKRGTNVAEAQLMKSGEDGARIMKQIVQDLGIVSNLKKKNTGTVFTLQRIAAAFPHVMMALAMAGEIRSFGDTPGLPDSFKWPGSPAMMFDTEWAKYMDPYLDYMVVMSKTINAKNQEFQAKTDQEIRSDQLTYANIQYGSEFNRKMLKDRRTAANRLSKEILAQPAAEEPPKKKGQKNPTGKPSADE